MVSPPGSGELDPEVRRYGPWDDGPTVPYLGPAEAAWEAPPSVAVPPLTAQPPVDNAGDPAMNVPSRLPGWRIARAREAGIKARAKLRDPNRRVAPSPPLPDAVWGRARFYAVLRAREESDTQPGIFRRWHATRQGRGCAQVVETDGAEPDSRELAWGVCFHSFPTLGEAQAYAEAAGLPGLPVFP